MQANLQADTTFTKIFVGGKEQTANVELIRCFSFKGYRITLPMRRYALSSPSSARSKKLLSLPIATRKNHVATDSYVSVWVMYRWSFVAQVTMAHREEAEAAVKEPNPTIDGRRANVNLAYLGAKNRTASLPRRFIVFAFSISVFLVVLVNYSLFARMPAYQSTTAAAAAAYPYV
jgi:hypothetical protein